MKIQLADDLALPLDVAEPGLATPTAPARKRKRTRKEKLATQRKYARKWRTRHRQELLEYYRRYRAEHPELKTYYADYHRTVTSQKKPRRLRIQPLDGEAFRIRQRSSFSRLRRAHPDTYTAAIATAKAKRPDLYRQHAAASAGRRRARKHGAPTERVSLKRIPARDNNLCHLCGAEVFHGDRSFDHLIPIARGGAHAEWNLMLAHLRCNKRRGAKQILPEETKEAAEAYIAAHAARKEAAA